MNTATRDVPDPARMGRATVATATTIAIALVVLFAITTNSIWEDYYITFRSSRNLIEGHGLVYQAGERVHSFTSPLGVLLPALGLWLTGSDAGALWFFRLVSAAALGGAAALIVLHGREQGWGRGMLWFALVLGVFDAKTVAFSANGMETGLLVFFTALVWREISHPGGPRWHILALGYGGLMWTRPDACIVAAAMTGSWWLFSERPRTAGECRSWLRGIFKAAIAGGLIYMPWFLWAWGYYGSPIPHTIIAKAGITPEGFSLLRILATPLRCLVEPTGIDGIFAPAYFSGTNWPRDVITIVRLLARLSAFLWLVPVLPRAGRAASLAVLIGGVYLHQIIPYPWYFAPWTLLAALTLAGGGGGILARAGEHMRAAGRIAACVVAVTAVGFLAAAVQASRIQQRVVEEAGRKRIGEWLHDHTTAGDTVFLESLGYIGYFSGLKMLDFPGLCAPEVTQLVHAGVSGYSNLIPRLNPTWVVIRPVEYHDHHLQSSEAMRSYELAGLWSVREQLDRVRILPNRGSLEFDADYLIFHRRPENTVPPSETP